MQVLDNKVFKKYILPVITIPFVWISLNILVRFVFQIGKYYGTFIRGLYEIIRNSL